MFTLQTEQPSLTLTPFAACLVGDADSPQTVRGPMATTAVSNASAVTSGKSTAFSVDGRGVSAHDVKNANVPQGVYVVDGKKMLVK